MIHGRVKWYSRRKGYGFIERDDAPRDVFVHRSEVKGLAFGEALREGEAVAFDLVLTPKGEAATNVIRLWRTHADRTHAGRFEQLSFYA